MEAATSFYFDACSRASQLHVAVFPAFVAFLFRIDAEEKKSTALDLAKLETPALTGYMNTRILPVIPRGKSRGVTW